LPFEPHFMERGEQFDQLLSCQTTINIVAVRV